MNTKRIIPPIVLGTVIVGVGYALISTSKKGGVDIVEISNYQQGTGSYIVEQAVGDVELVVNNSFTLTGGIFRMGKRRMKVAGDFYLGRNAKFIPSKAPLIIDGSNRTISIKVEKRRRNVVIPARYGPAYTMTGVLLYGTGELITATGSRIEWYTPPVGNLIIK